MIHILNGLLPLRTVALRLCEAILIFAALLLTYDVVAHQYLASASSVSLQIALVESVILLCMYSVDFYEPEITTQRAQSLSRLVQASGLTMLIIAAFHVLPVNINSAAVFLGILLVIPILAASRWLFADLTNRSFLAVPAILWGAGPLAASLVRELRKRPDLGIRVLGIVDSAYNGETLTGVRHLGSPDLIWTMAECGKVRRIIIAMGERRGSLPVEKLIALKAVGFTVEDGVELYENLTGKVWLDGFTISSLLFSHHFKKSLTRRILNRTLSLFFATIALIVTSPVMLLIATLIRLDSKGPAIFRQARVGENGCRFTLFKFRSMKADAEAGKVFMPAAVNDPRCTRLGKWLRRFRLDELPQLFNILRGDMYFVGPRPFVPEQEAALIEQIPYYHQRWNVRPGTTGWAQVHRGYNASIEDNVEKLAYDLFYIKNMSLGLDLLTMLKTFKIVLLGRGR